MTSEETIADLTTRLEQEQAYTSMRDMSYDADVKRASAELIAAAEKRGYEKGARQAVTTDELQHNFSEQLEHWLNEHIPQMVEDAIPKEYRAGNFHKALQPRAAVSTYRTPETMDTVTNVVLDFPQTRIMLGSMSQRDY